VIVLDTSAAVDYLLGYAAAEWVEEELRAADRVHAPHLLDVEVIGGLRKHVQIGIVSSRRAAEAISDYKDLRVRRYSHHPFLGQMWRMRQNLTGSDAAFVALAEALEAALVTTDFKLARAPGLKIEIRTP
jgi:predicted nucleic acid-binding protein